MGIGPTKDGREIKGGRMRVNPYQYPFIAIEGPDDCGKSTLIKKLQSFDRNSIFTKEPTDGPLGQEIREILKNNGFDKNGRKITAEELQLLYIKDRLEHRENEAGFLEKYPIFSDRDFISTMAYGMAEGLSPYWILNTLNDVIGEYFFVPDLTLILNLSVKEAMKRAGKSGKKADYFEEKLALRKRINVAYLAFPFLMGKINREVKMNVRIIDASKTPEEVFDEAIRFIAGVFSDKYLKFKSRK